MYEHDNVDFETNLCKRYCAAQTRLLVVGRQYLHAVINNIMTFRNYTLVQTQLFYAVVRLLVNFT